MKVTEIMADIQGSMEQLWKSGNYDTQDDVVADVEEQVKEWRDSWESLCGCNRPLRDCICP